MISSALPTGRIRELSGAAPCASRIAASRATLYRASAVRNASRGSAPAGSAASARRGRSTFGPVLARQRLRRGRHLERSL